MVGWGSRCDGAPWIGCAALDLLDPIFVRPSCTSLPSPLTPTGAFPARQFARHGFAHEIGAILVVLKHGSDTRERPLGEPSLHILVPALLSTHVANVYST
jgi:hypothetical protein